MKMARLSKTQIDRLGERLRVGAIDRDDVIMLASYRSQFRPAYEHCVATLHRELGLIPSGRPAKSTVALQNKLRRETVRLSQIQDIAGCRIVLSDGLVQDNVVSAVCRNLPSHVIVDRRKKPSHGYRAVHVIARVGGAAVEIQVRTPLQHLWAEVCEKFSDTLDPAIKYGGGPENVRELLLRLSDAIAQDELIHQQQVDLEQRVRLLPEELQGTLGSDIAHMRKKLEEQHEALRTTLQTLAELEVPDK
jgi:ppGpp synthetase/RelA/SpoT-type nucleotidyltranferase